MEKRLMILFWVLFLVVYNTNPVECESDQELFFDGFKNNNMSLNGAAEIEKNGILKLTNDTHKVLGHAFYSSPIRFKNSTDGKVFSFSTAFAFAIVPEYPKLGGHGLAFTASPDKHLTGSLPSQFLGILNSTDVGNFSNHVFAVEFDTVQDLEFQDIDDNHVGIDINSLRSNKSTPAAYFNDNGSAKQELNLKSGKVTQVWIDYDSAKTQLSVKLSPSSTKPRSPILTFDVDLSPIFEDFMYVGFSSSTGALASSHYIAGWSFKINGEAKSLNLPTLPLLPGTKKSHSGLVIGVSVVATMVIILLLGISVYLIRKMKYADMIEDWELDVGPHRFSYQELKKATKGFRDKELLGFGGFGRVYRGTLPNSKTQIAVKRISHESKGGVQQFVSEISSIGRLRHRNLVQLLGWCRRREDLLLVYDFMPNGSLDKYLFDEPRSILTWKQRFNIIKDVASGLLYLHEEWEQTVIHRDIKAANVLLDSDMNSRLGDFGLAKLYERGSNPSTTKVVGTLGYLAPELTRTGKPTTSSDVFAFGALILETVCGRRPIEAKALPEELVLLDWVWDWWNKGSVLEVVDPRLQGQFDEVEAAVAIKLGLLCSNSAPEKRPTMRQVVRYLEGEVELLDTVAPPVDEYGCGVKGGGGGGGGGDGSGSNCNIGEFEDYFHSYPPSSHLEKVSTGSSAGDHDDGDVDVAGGSASPLFVLR